MLPCIHTATKHHLETCQCWFCVKWQPHQNPKPEPEMQISSHSSGPAQIFSRKTLVALAEPPTTYPILPRRPGGRTQTVPRCLLVTIKNGIRNRLRSCAAARARAEADNTASLRTARAKVAWGATQMAHVPPGRPTNGSESDAYPATCTGAPDARHMHSQSYSHAVAGWLLYLYSPRPDDHFSHDICQFMGLSALC
jgi:hypothetical protein